MPQKCWLAAAQITCQTGLCHDPLFDSRAMQCSGYCTGQTHSLALTVQCSVQDTKMPCNALFRILHWSDCPVETVSKLTIWSQCMHALTVQFIALFKILHWSDQLSDSSEIQCKYSMSISLHCSRYCIGRTGHCPVDPLSRLTLWQWMH